MVLDNKTKELISVRIAIAENCIPCFQWHFKKCMGLDFIDKLTK